MRMRVSFALRLVSVGTLYFGAVGPMRAGALYVGVSTRTTGSVQQVLSDGTVKPFASGLSIPNALTFDSAGNLYEADEGLHTVNRIGLDGHVSAVVPFGTFDGPMGLAFNGSGDLFVADPTRGLYQVAPDATVTRVVPSSQSFQPFGLAYHDGSIFAASEDGTVRRITATGAISTYASGLGPVLWGLAFDANDNLFVADSKGIERVAPDGAVSSFAPSLAQFQPIGLTFDSNGNLYAACFNNREIKQITPAGAISTFATVVGQPRYLVDAVPEPTGMVLLLWVFGLARRRPSDRGVHMVRSPCLGH